MIWTACSARVKVIRPSLGSRRKEEYWDQLVMSVMRVGGGDMARMPHLCQT